MYAIVNISGKQYKVEEGRELLVDGGWGQKDQKLEIDKVLLIANGEKTKVGTPYVQGAKVEAEVLGEEKGKKIDVVKYKAKARYRRHYGHRDLFTRILVTKISTS